jgi:hypothetical protein
MNRVFKIYFKNLLASLLKNYFPHFQLTDCEDRIVAQESIILTFEVGEHASTLAILSDFVTTSICV